VITRSSRCADRLRRGALPGRASAGTLWPTAPRVRLEESPSPVYGAALLMRLGGNTLGSSNLPSSAPWPSLEQLSAEGFPDGSLGPQRPLAEMTPDERAAYVAKVCQVLRDDEVRRGARRPRTVR
jgi:hypothetical protein